MEILTSDLWEMRSKKKISKTAYLFDRYGPSTAYAVCFTVNALCLLTGFPRLQENKNHSQRPETHTRHSKERDSRGVGWSCRAWLCVLVCVWGQEKIWGPEGESEGLCAKTKYCKKKCIFQKKKTISKEAWNQQTSRPAQQTAVTPTCKKKKNYRDQTKTAPDTSQHRGDRGQPHIESWLSPETLLGDPSLCLRPRAGLEWTRGFSCTFNIVSLWLHFKNIITGQRKRREK